jgi:hypothetical protein
MGSTDHTSINERVLKVRIPSQELLLQERGILDISIECDVDDMAWREVFEMDRLEERHTDNEEAQRQSETPDSVRDEGFAPAYCLNETASGKSVNHEMCSLVAAEVVL